MSRPASLAADALTGVAQLMRNDDRVDHVKIESNDHWLCVDVYCRHATFPASMTEPVRLAIWLTTGELYRVGPDGAVEEDPIRPDEALNRENVRG